MTLRTKRRLLAVTSLTLLSLAGAMLTWGFTSVPVMPERSNARPFAASDSKAKSPQTTVTLEIADFEPHWQTPLRQQLFDPPPSPPPVVEKPPPRPIAAKLLATMIEQEQSTAMLQLASGDVVFRKVGDPIGPEDLSAKIETIEPGIATVRRESEETATKLLIEGATGN